jgi:pyruvate dehydrogenase E1 component alpha subunit
MKIKDIATRASAYGMEGVITDGNDVLAVYETVRKAVEKARDGGGPTLVECKTYRRGGHSRTDGNIYRNKEEEKEWLAKDPIPRMKEYLISKGILTEAKSKEIEQKKEKEIDDAVEFAKSSPSPKPEDALEDVFA